MDNKSIQAIKADYLATFGVIPCRVRYQAKRVDDPTFEFPGWYIEDPLGEWRNWGRSAAEVNFNLHMQRKQEADQEYMNAATE